MVQNEGTAMLLVSKDQLKDIVMNAVKDAVSIAMREAKKMYEADRKEDVTIKASEVTAKYGVSSTTLWRWEKAGVLKCVKVGGHNRYRVADVERVMNGEVC